MKKFFIQRLWLLVGMLFLGACGDSSTVIDLSKGHPMATDNIPGKPLKIVVGAAVTPETGFAYYRQLLDLIGEKMNRPVEFIIQNSYGETNDLLHGGLVDAAFVCGHPYVVGHQEFGLELLALPQVAGTTTYHSLLIVHRDSPYQRLEDLAGRVFAFTDPMSNSGWLVPTYQLWQLGKRADSFFARYVYTYGHEKSIKAVAQRLVDAAAVDSLVFDYDQRRGVPYEGQVRVIATSPPYGIPPVVVPKGLDAAIKTELATTLLSLHEDPKGQAILQGLAIERFVAGDDTVFDSIRTMKAALAGKK